MTEKMSQIILASSSKIRQQILQTRVNFTVKEPNCDEDQIKASAKDLSIDKLVKKLAFEKANSVFEKNKVIIGCDQILYFDKKIYDKCKNLTQVKERLQQLSNKSHYLINGVCILYNKKKFTQVEKVKISFAKLSNNEIDAYIEKYGEKLLASVGGYQLENEGLFFIKKIKGDYQTALGLPILKIGKILRKLKKLS